MPVTTHTITVTSFLQNCSLLICEKTRDAALIDPGGDIDKISAVIEKTQARLSKILITHGHHDHCAGARPLAERYNVPVEGPHQADDFWLQRLPQQSLFFNLPEAPALIPDRWLQEGDTIRFGACLLTVYHCPGHTPGHLVFFHRESSQAWVGDVLFAGSVGRTDFPLGNHQDLINSIEQKLWPLGDNVRFFPGHGQTSTFGIERTSNPYFSNQKNVEAKPHTYCNESGNLL